jgi:hypothetical protein
MTLSHAMSINSFLKLPKGNINHKVVLFLGFFVYLGFNCLKIMEKHNLSFFTEYYQFYILDSETKAQTDAHDFWNAEADKRKLAIGEGLLGVTVAKYAEIKVEVRVLSVEPNENAEADHIVETSLNLPSGLLQIKDCTSYDTVLELKLEKGTYRIRISSFKLWAVKGDEGDDYYMVEMWKAVFSDTVIIKEWKS